MPGALEYQCLFSSWVSVASVEVSAPARARAKALAGEGLDLSGDVSECSDALPENLGVFTHARFLANQPFPLVVWQASEDR